MAKIKKYLDYFLTDIREIVSEEELEDQFLRLKEVFNCSVTWKNFKFTNISSISSDIEGCLISAKKDHKEIEGEINSIKDRIKRIYPNVDISIEKIKDIEKYTRGKYKDVGKLFFYKILISKKSNRNVS